MKMKVKKKYISGFTLVEMLMSLIITAIVTASMMFVYNQAQIKFYNDSMELDIATYGNRSVNMISTKLLNNITQPVKQIGDWGGFNSYEITFLDKDRNGNSEEKTIRIRMSETGGFIITKGNTNVTNTIFDGMYLNAGAFRPGNSFEDYNIPTSYVIDSWSIEPLTADSLYHHLNPSKIRAMTASSYAIKLNFEIQTEEEGSFGSSLYKVKTFWTYSFSPGLYLREKSRHSQDENI